jgi:hypothetical protein
MTAFPLLLVQQLLLLLLQANPFTQSKPSPALFYNGLVASQRSSCSNG